MIWLLRLSVSILLSSVSVSVALAQAAKADDDIFIRHVALVQNWENPNGGEALIETFKHRLRDHGYKTNDCGETKQAWEQIVKDADGAIPYEEIGKKLVTAAECVVPDTAKRAYSARLILDYDPKLERRQAVLYLLPLFGGAKLDGTYTHKQGTMESWYQIIDRVIARAIGRYNERTAIRLHLPKEAEVGDVVKLDASDAWDPDGEAFELRWRIHVQACVGEHDVLPKNLHDCPGGYKLQDWVVRDRAGQSGQIRELSVPMVGDYRIQVHAKIGKRDEPVSSFTLRALPRREWVIFTTVQALRLPTFFLSDREGSHVSLVRTLGVEKRFMHRLGLFGWHEEVHYGLALAAFNSFGTRGDALALSLEVISRTLDRTGRYGLITTARYGVLMVEGDRSYKADHLEAGMLIGLFMGAYYAFGNNYMFQSTPYCSDVCPSLAIGPTLSALLNYGNERYGVALGVEGQVLIEF